MGTQKSSTVEDTVRARIAACACSGCFQTSMEGSADTLALFQAITGCSDDAVARRHLTIADGDVNRAVNHYLEGTADVTATIDAPSTPVRRPRKDEIELIEFDDTDAVTPTARSAAAAVSSEAVAVNSAPALSTPPLSRKRPRTDERWREHLQAKEDLLQQLPQQQQPVDSSTVDAAIAQWQRRGQRFEDAAFPHTSVSIDGRAPAAARTSSSSSSTSPAAEVQCACRAAAKLCTVRKAGANQNRTFYSCSSRKCGFFQWCAAPPTTQQARRLVWRLCEPPKFCLYKSLRGEPPFRPDDIRQGAVGDCWFLAGTATVCLTLSVEQHRAFICVYELHTASLHTAHCSADCSHSALYWQYECYSLACAQHCMQHCAITLNSPVLQCTLNTKKCIHYSTLLCAQV
jgi:UBA-like domain/GRF zinc finger